MLDSETEDEEFGELAEAPESPIPSDSELLESAFDLESAEPPPFDSGDPETLFEHISEPVDGVAPRRGKYHDLLAPEVLDHIACMRMAGSPQAEIARELGVSSALLSERKRLHPELWEAMNPGRPWPGYELAAQTHQGEPGAQAARARGRLMEGVEKLASKIWLGKVTEWVRQGIEQDSVAALLDMLPEDFARELAANRDLQIAVRKGQAEGELIAARAAWAIIKNPAHKKHAEALKFYLQTRGKWRTPSSLDVRQERQARDAAAQEAPDAMGGAAPTLSELDAILRPSEE